MEQVYSQQHISQAHHHGLVTGTLVGSLFVSGFIAVAAVAASPNLILHPFNLTSELSSKQTTNQEPQLGSVGSTVSDQISTRNLVGQASDAVSRLSSR